MPLNDKQKQELRQFILEMLQSGEEPNQVKGILGKERGDASHDEVVAFVNNEVVLEGAFKFVLNTLSQWTQSNRGKSPLDQPVQFASLTSQEVSPNGGDVQKYTWPYNEQNKRMEKSGLDAIQSPTSSENANEIDLLKLQNQQNNPKAAESVPSPNVNSLESAPLNPSTQPGQVPAAGGKSYRPVDSRISFHLPNAKVGQPYAERIHGVDGACEHVSIVDVKIPENIGLVYDEATTEIRGTPTVDGDHKFVLRWKDGSGSATGECVLIVNPDPKSLWKNIDPPIDDPYFKSNIDSQYIDNSEYKIAVASRRGRSHEHVGSFRDDDFYVANAISSGWNILIVADGAGSAKSSRWGSKLAVKAAGEHIATQLSGSFGSEMNAAIAGYSANFAESSKVMNAPFYLLFQEASKLAVKSIEDEALLKGVNPKEYSTTLLAAVVKREGKETFLATFWMGDGAIAAYGPTGKVRLMGTPDGGEYAGQTRFLDSSALKDPNFGKRFKMGCFADLKAVILMTDGISDPRFETDNGLSDSAKWDALWAEISLHLASPEPDKSLAEWMNFFSPGHHDDRTIAVLW